MLLDQHNLIHVFFYEKTKTYEKLFVTKFVEIIVITFYFYFNDKFYKN